MISSEHPSVQRVRERLNAASGSERIESLDAVWLRAICLEAGADDVGFVEIDRTALQEESQVIRGHFPRCRSLISIVCRMNRSPLRSSARSVANLEFHHVGDRVNEVCSRIVSKLESKGIDAGNPSMGFPMEMDQFPGRIWVVSHKLVAQQAGLGVMGILGIQGERWAEWSTPKDLRFNYTYVNWMGRSTYKGFPFTDRESPLLVVDVIDELDKLHSFGRVFVGGHSQGGFLTFILHMHFPEKLAGTFPIAGGMPIQSDPQAFDDNALMAEQRKKPMVIIHGTRDNVVSPSMSAYAHQSFLAHDFHLVKRLSPEAGHPFDLLPINDAIDWLDLVTSSDPTVLAEFATKQTEKKSWRDVGAVVQRAKVLGVEEQLRDSIAAFEAAAAENVESHLNAIRSNADGNWIVAFLQSYDQFALSEAAQPVIRAFQDSPSMSSRC